MAKAMKFYGHCLGWGIALFMLFSCSNMPKPTTTASLDATTASLDATTDGDASQDYEIGPEDILEILVWKNDALSKVVTVRPDGKISLPLIGDVQASGHSAVQVKEAIAEKLTEYYKEPPQVSVIIEQAKNGVVYIIGEVQRPGQYVVKHGTTLLQSIALAGGFTPFASTNNIVILRRGDNGNQESTIKVRYQDILSGRHLRSNRVLRPLDTIIIP